MTLDNEKHYPVKCKYCGKEFIPRSGSQKYCCEECQTKAKEAVPTRQIVSSRRPTSTSQRCV